MSVDILPDELSTSEQDFFESLGKPNFTPSKPDNSTSKDRGAGVSCCIEKVGTKRKARKAKFPPFVPVNGWSLPLRGSAGDECGFIREAFSCPANLNKSALSRGHHDMKYIRYGCNRPTCPVCGPSIISKRTYTVMERFEAFEKTMNGKNEFSAYVFSPPQAWALEREGVGGYKYMRKGAKRVIKLSGIKAGFMVFHYFRVKKKYKDEYKIVKSLSEGNTAMGLWEWLRLTGQTQKAVYASPHFHVIATGWTIPSDEFETKTGWVMNKTDLFDKYAVLGKTLSAGDPVWSVSVLNPEGHARISRLVRYLFSHQSFLLDDDGKQKVHTTTLTGGLYKISVSVENVWVPLKNKHIRKKRIVRIKEVAECKRCGDELRLAVKYDTEIEKDLEVCSCVHELSDTGTLNVKVFTKYINKANKNTVWLPMNPSDYKDEQLARAKDKMASDAKLAENIRKFESKECITGYYNECPA